MSQVHKAESTSRVAAAGTASGRSRVARSSTAAQRAESSRRSGAGLEIYGLLLTAFAILLLLSLVSFDPRDTALDQRLRAGPISNLVGPVGAHIADLLFRVLGLFAVALCSTFFYFGGLLLAGRRPAASGGGLTAYLLLLAFGGAFAHVTLAAYRPFGHMPGGVAGA